MPLTMGTHFNRIRNDIQKMILRKQGCWVLAKNIFEGFFHISLYHLLIRSK